MLDRTVPPVPLHPGCRPIHERRLCKQANLRITDPVGRDAVRLLVFRSQLHEIAVVYVLRPVRHPGAPASDQNRAAILYLVFGREIGPRLRQMQGGGLVIADADQEHVSVQLVQAIERRVVPEYITWKRNKFKPFIGTKLTVDAS